MDLFLDSIPSEDPLLDRAKSSNLDDEAEYIGRKLGCEEEVDEISSEKGYDLFIPTTYIPTIKSKSYLLNLNECTTNTYMIMININRGCRFPTLRYTTYSI